MSVRDLNKVFIVTDCLTGEIIDTIDFSKYGILTIEEMIKDLFVEYCVNNEHGLMIKDGYKN